NVVPYLGGAIFFLLTCGKMPVCYLIVLLLKQRRPAGKQATSPAKASSVPGIKHTAMPRSSTSAKPRVPVPKSRVTSLSPTFAGLDRTLWRLKSHIGDSFPPAWCPGLSMPPFTPAVTSRSKNGADTRWIFDGESLVRVFPSCFPKVYASSAASLRSCCRSGYPTP